VTAITALLVSLYVPPVRRIFHFSVLHFNDLLIATLAGFFGVLWFETLKLLTRAFRRPLLRPEVKA